MTETPLPPAGGPEAPGFFDAPFLEELQDLARSLASESSPVAVLHLPEKLAAFLERPPELALQGQSGPLTEAEFVRLPPLLLTERVNALIDACRDGRREAAQAVENFAVFFRALVPTLSEDGSREIRRVFFRMAPTLIQIAYDDFAELPQKRDEGHAALRALETVLIEIAGLRLAPSETELVFRSIGQMVDFIGAGDYTISRDVISAQLLGIIARNRLTRALYRLMEIEVALQVYLKERLGYSTPRIRLPDDVAQLSDYGPLRVFEEEGAGGGRRRFIQVHLPNIPKLEDVVLHLVEQRTQAHHQLRLDKLGSAQLELPDGEYGLGLAYEPEAR